MPTGYTAKLYEGKAQTFEEFTLEAARAMGAAIMQRDSAPGPIADEYEPSDYYRKSLAKDEATLKQYSRRTDVEWQEAEAAWRHEQTKATVDAIEKAGALRVRYERMLAEVQAWVPPTSEHQGLKDFMVQQLTESIKFDCSTTYLDIPPKRSWQDFKAQRIAEAEKSLKRSHEGWAEELERTESRNKWVRDLRLSLDSETAPAGTSDSSSTDPVREA